MTTMNYNESQFKTQSHSLQAKRTCSLGQFPFIYRKTLSLLLLLSLSSLGSDNLWENCARRLGKSLDRHLRIYNRKFQASLMEIYTVLPRTSSTYKPFKMFTICVKPNYNNQVLYGLTVINAAHLTPHTCFLCLAYMASYVKRIFMLRDLLCFKFLRLLCKSYENIATFYWVFRLVLFFMLTNDLFIMFVFIYIFLMR